MESPCTQKTLLVAGRKLDQTRNGGLVDVEPSRKISLGSSAGADCFQRVFLLVAGQLGRAAHVHPAALGPLPSFSGSGANQFAFKLG